MPDEATSVNPAPPRTAYPGQAAGGRIGALRSWALTTDRAARTKPARDARLRKFIAEVMEKLPDLTDEADILRRAEMLRRADMLQLSQRAATARRRAAAERQKAAEAEAELAELDATGLADCGSDGIDVG